MLSESILESLRLLVKETNNLYVYLILDEIFAVKIVNVAWKFISSII